MFYCLCEEGTFKVQSFKNKLTATLIYIQIQTALYSNEILSKVYNVHFHGFKFSCAEKNILF